MKIAISFECITYINVILLVIICDKSFSENNLPANDSELKHNTIGTWVINERIKIDNAELKEEGYITFNTNGCYFANATENDEHGGTYSMTWGGRWQINNCILTTPTTNTAGFEGGLHPKVFISKCKIVQLDKKFLICEPTYSRTHHSTFSFARATN